MIFYICQVTKRIFWKHTFLYIFLTTINNGRGIVHGQGTSTEMYSLSLHSKPVELIFSRLLGSPVAGSCRDGSADDCQWVYQLSNLQNTGPKIRVPGAPAKVHSESRSLILISAADSSRVHYLKRHQSSALLCSGGKARN